MSDKPYSLQIEAVQDFRAARLHADVELIKAALTGKSADLLSYEDVRQRLHVQETNQRKLKEIPIEAIVGSVGRYTDFTRNFFPRREKSEQRWKNIKVEAESLEGFAPIEAYQIGEAYFVIDGNHRVSVARSLGFEFIEGYVTLVEASAQLSSDAGPDELIILERYNKFLKKTQLKESIPGADLQMSSAGNYRFLERQIYVHQRWLGKNVLYEDAAKDWYRTIYCPVIQIIRERGMLRDFPSRTETDLYVWIEKYRKDLAENLEWTIDPENAVISFIENSERKSGSILQRASQMLYDALVPEALDAGPIPGEWRKTRLTTNQNESLFRDILVAINGQEDGWNALDQALIFAQKEKSRLYGFHFLSEETNAKTRRTHHIQSTFNYKLKKHEISGDIFFVSGNIPKVLGDRARWVDLVVVSIKHPPETRPIDRLSSGLSQLLRRCPRPVLTVPETSRQITHILLAYDGSLASKEALYVSAYLVDQWNIKLTTVTVQENGDVTEILTFPQKYLAERNISVDFIQRRGEAGPEIIKTADKYSCDLIIMGSYKRSPIMEVVLGSTVDEVLRAFDGSVLICR